MEHVMERVEIVIALGANGADRGLELSDAHRRFAIAPDGRFLFKTNGRHRLTSIPSKPTSQPALSTTLRASEFSSSTGFELLMCT
jgi:hypothetical protein